MFEILNEILNENGDSGKGGDWWLSKSQFSHSQAEPACFCSTKTHHLVAEDKFEEDVPYECIDARRNGAVLPANKRGRCWSA